MITKPFTETEVRKIEKELSRRTDKVRDLALFRMGVDTMLRTSDLRNLRVQDVRRLTQSCLITAAVTFLARRTYADQREHCWHVRHVASRGAR